MYAKNMEYAVYKVAWLAGQNDGGRTSICICSTNRANSIAV